MSSTTRAAAVLVAVSAVAIALTRPFRTDLQLQNRLEGPGGALLLVGLLVVAAGAMSVLSRDPATRGYPTATWSVAGVSALVLVPAHHLEWLRGTAFEAALWLQVLVYGAAMLGWVSLALGGYLLVAERSRPVALALYGVFVTGFTIGGVLAVREYEDDGTYVLDNGYNIVLDALWGVVMFAIALVVLLRVRARALTVDRP